MYSPRSAALVPSTATGPMECQDLMALDFKSHYFQAYAYLPSYSDWFLLDADLTSDLPVRAAGAASCCSGAPPAKPWRLKCPTHLLLLDHLDRSFPDARFVMTHRDPTDVIVSVADVYLEVGGMFSEDIDLHYLGALNVEHWSVGHGTGARVPRPWQRRPVLRHRLPHHADRPDRRGPPSSTSGWASRSRPSSRRAWRSWWAEYAANREQNVHPDPATFGLDLDDVRPKFADYTARMAQWTAH